MIPASTTTACVIDGVIVAKGSAAAMRSLVRKHNRGLPADADRAGLAHTWKAIGERWQR